MSEYMLFCLGSGQYASEGEGFQKSYRIFNQDVPKDEWEKINSSLNIKLPLIKWIDKKDMTKEEKDNNSVWKETGGYLKVLSYEDAWRLWWDDAIQKEKDSILDIKYFDPVIFKNITGIDVDKPDKEIILSNGYKVSEKTIREALEFVAKSK